MSQSACRDQSSTCGFTTFCDPESGISFVSTLFYHISVISHILQNVLPYMPFSFKVPTLKSFSLWKKESPELVMVDYLIFISLSLVHFQILKRHLVSLVSFSDLKTNCFDNQPSIFENFSLAAQVARLFQMYPWEKYF